MGLEKTEKKVHSILEAYFGRSIGKDNTLYIIGAEYRDCIEIEIIIETEFNIPEINIDLTMNAGDISKVICQKKVAAN